jgi:predicted metallo-beta-lactamase superfamily hydrolase
VQTVIECGGEKFIHTSDVEGPAMPDQIRFVIEEQPDVVILDGPMTPKRLRIRSSLTTISRAI